MQNQKFTKEQAIVISGYTGYLACSFGDFHGAVEKKLGRPIWTHQFASPELKQEIKDAYREEFIAMCAGD